jgi:hypothetical protein
MAAFPLGVPGAIGAQLPDRPPGHVTRTFGNAEHEVFASTVDEEDIDLFRGEHFDQPFGDVVRHLLRRPVRSACDNHPSRPSSGQLRVSTRLAQRASKSGDELFAAAPGAKSDGLAQ